MMPRSVFDLGVLCFTIHNSKPGSQVAENMGRIFGECVDEALSKDKTNSLFLILGKLADPWTL
jgi:hypothetical protein